MTFEQVRIQRFIVSIELAHVGKVSATDANYDNGKWQVGRSNNLINGLLHVHNDAVCDDE